MAEIELVIKIPEEVKQAFDCAESNDIKGCYYDHGGVIGNAIKNGTPLPTTEEKSCATCGQPKNYAGDCILFMEGKCVARYEKWESATKRMCRMTRKEAIETLKEIWELLFKEMRSRVFEELNSTGEIDKFKTALDMAIEELKQTDFADFILHWLADSYGCICDYDFAGINASDYLYEHDNDYCEEGCGKNTDYDCWKKFLELKYQEHKREGDGE